MATLEDYQAAVRTTTEGPIAAVSIANGKGRAYFKRPSNEQWDEWQALGASSDVAGKKTAYTRMVSQCFIGAWTPLGELNFDQMISAEGPGFVNGAAGEAVNHLAGAGARDTTFL